MQFSFVQRLRSSWRTLQAVHHRAEHLALNQGRLWVAIDEGRYSPDLKDHEFRVFSQWGEDGILQYLVRSLPIAHRTFIEFGVEDFVESNCRFLMMNDNWSGFVIDGSPENIRRLEQAPYFWKHDLRGVAAFITRENINELLAKSGFAPEVGILSIDLDGIDYHVLEALQGWQPAILVCEYNAVFGPQRKVTVPYEPDFVRGRKHPSYLYVGASLGALAHAAVRKGYALVGTNSAGNNAFFVRQDLVNDRVRVLSVEEAFTPSRFREAKDAAGNLTFARGEERLAIIRGLPVLNVETGQIEPL